MSESDWGQYVGQDEPEDCCFGISKDLKKGHGTAKISNGSLRSLVVDWGPGKLHKMMIMIIIIVIIVIIF